MLVNLPENEYWRCREFTQGRQIPGRCPTLTHPVYGGSITMNRLEKQLTSVSDSLKRISLQLTDLAMQMDKEESVAAAPDKPQKAGNPAK
jgi:hypothetical protein